MVDDLTRLGHALRTDFLSVVDGLRHGWLDDAPLAGADWQRLWQLEADSLHLWHLTAQMDALQQWLTVGFLPDIFPGSVINGEPAPAIYPEASQPLFWQTPTARSRPAALASSPSPQAVEPPRPLGKDAANDGAFPTGPTPAAQLRQQPVASPAADRPSFSLPARTDPPVIASPRPSKPDSTPKVKGLAGLADFLTTQPYEEPDESNPLSTTHPASGPAFDPSFPIGPNKALIGRQSQPRSDDDDLPAEMNKPSGVTASDENYFYPQPQSSVTPTPNSVQEPIAAPHSFLRSPEGNVIELPIPDLPKRGEKQRISPPGRPEKQESIPNSATVSSEERLSKNLSPQVDEQPSIGGLADLVQTLEAASPVSSRSDDETPQSPRHRRRVGQTAVAWPDLASPELLELAAAATWDSEHAQSSFLQPGSDLLPSSPGVSQPGLDLAPTFGPDAASSEEAHAQLQPLVAPAASSPAAERRFGANGQLLSSDLLGPQAPGGDYPAQGIEPAGSPSGAAAAEHAAKVTRLSGFEPLPELENADVDLILEALAAEIKREYKRFYGD